MLRLHHLVRTSINAGDRRWITHPKSNTLMSPRTSNPMFLQSRGRLIVRFFLQWTKASVAGDLLGLEVTMNDVAGVTMFDGRTEIESFFNASLVKVNPLLSTSVSHFPPKGVESLMT